MFLVCGGWKIGLLPWNSWIMSCSPCLKFQRKWIIFFFLNAHDPIVLIISHACHEIIYLLETIDYGTPLILHTRPFLRCFEQHTYFHDSFWNVFLLVDCGFKLVPTIHLFYTCEVFISLGCEAKISPFFQLSWSDFLTCTSTPCSKFWMGTRADMSRKEVGNNREVGNIRREHVMKKFT